MYISLSELEKDVLRELVNISLAKAADSFAELVSDQVLLRVPDINLIEPTAIPQVLSEFDNSYWVIKTNIEDGLSGYTYLLFSHENLEKLSFICRNLDISKEECTDRKEATLGVVSRSITYSLAHEMSQLLDINLRISDSHSLFNRQEKPIDSILKELPANQPLIITVKTQFNELGSLVEVPMLIIFDSASLFKILNIIRSKNLYKHGMLLGS